MVGDCRRPDSHIGLVLCGTCAILIILGILRIIMHGDIASIVG